MPAARLTLRCARAVAPLLALVAACTAVLLGPLAGARSTAEDMLTNESVIGMVKAGLGEGIIVQKIRASARKFDTSTDGLLKLKAAGVPDKVIEAMIGGAPPAPAPGEPMIAHLGPAGARLLKAVHGDLETSFAPYVGSRQEVVLERPRAEYRITDAQPLFSTNLAAEQWALVRLKPGKRDRNLPINKNSGWIFEGVTFRQGPDPKYRVPLALVGEPSPDGTIRLKPTEPLASGEYGLVPFMRGRPNVYEVFDFGVD
jgi:hypothetical protein